jgi:uncharacterized protein (TIGR00369 family)
MADIEIPLAQRPYYRHLGLTVMPPEDGTLRVVMDAMEELSNSRGEVHGGAIASLLDVTISSALRSTLGEGGAAATASLTINYLEPGQGRLTGVGRVVRKGRTIASVEARIEDDAGTIVAHGVGIMRVLRSGD